MTKQIAVTLDIAEEARKQNLQGAANHNTPDGGFGILFGNLLSIIMLLAAILVFAFLIMGALQWLTSGGDKGKVEGARNKMTNAVIGLVILSAVVAIFTLVEEFLGISFLTFDNNMGIWL